ncbi:hypothetical protein [Paenibacillus sp. HJGM_3]|uniref:hypothetical protein n=1 Tax=Paenibacillus sp. HJGM_3 TaxID=3379816 RepID=UPI00385BB067
MEISDRNPERLTELTDIIEHAISMELRVDNMEVEDTVARMEGYGFKFKNAWPSMELPDCTVIEFWRKELIK